jgi:hypothetical protein
MRRFAPAGLPGPLRVLAGLAPFALCMVAGQAARAQTVDVLYEVSLAGLPIGTATLSGKLDPESYRLEVRAKLTGLAGLITNGKGAGIATGSAATGKILPATYALSSAGSSGSVLVRMALNQGKVEAVEITPPLAPKADRVPLLDEHRRGILDPVSALLMPQATRGSGLDASACNRTLPVFDGAGRFDVTLSSAGTRNVAVPGYAGPVAVCSARYTPIAGHRTGRKSTQFMAANREMEAWLAPVEGTRFLVPYRIQIRTMVGITTIEAARFTVNGKSTAQAPRPEPTKAGN